MLFNSVGEAAVVNKEIQSATFRYLFKLAVSLCAYFDNKTWYVVSEPKCGSYMFAPSVLP